MKTALFASLTALLWVGCDAATVEEDLQTQGEAKSVAEPAQKPAEKPTEKPAEKPTEKSAEAPQGKSTKSSQDAVNKALAQFHAVLKNEGIKIDLAKGTLTVPTIVNRPTNDLEYLLIHRQGKMHEALLYTLSKPSVINTGLIAIGVKQGKNASYVKKDPVPTEAQQKAGVDPYILVPPSGGEVYMTVSFEDKAGKTVVMPIEELLLDWAANQSVAENSWVFLGGRMAQMYRGEPEVFMADFEGNLISICYKYPQNHLLTMVHALARDEMNWAIAPGCPPPATAVALTFHRTKPQVIIDRDARVNQRPKADLDDRPNRNPAREGGGPPPRRVDKQTEKKGSPKKK